MTSTDLSIITLVAAIALFITSHIARRSTNPASPIHTARKVLIGVVLALVAFYFYKRIMG